MSKNTLIGPIKGGLYVFMTEITNMNTATMMSVIWLYYVSGDDQKVCQCFPAELYLREGTANALKNTLGKKKFTFMKGRS